MIIVIPGWLVSIVTFPGVVLHEISHRFFCDLMNVPVLSVKYFDPFGDSAGCVVHVPTNNLRKVFLISIGPLIINSLVCMVCTIPGAISLLFESRFVVSYSPALALAKYMLLWIGLAAGFQAIPSRQDITGLKELAQSIPQKILVYLLSGFVWLANVEFVGSFVRIIFAIILMFLIPIVLIFSFLH